MSDLVIIVTDAGRAALVNAANNGTAPVVIAAAGVSSSVLAPTPQTAALPGEIKRIATLSGDVVSDDTIHLILRDESADQYTLRSLAFYLGDGTLFAVYGQALPIIEKSAQSMLLLAVDIRFADIDAAALSFGDTNFLNPPATTDRLGVVELATDAEATTGNDSQRAVTPKGLKTAVTSWLDGRFGEGAPSAFIKGLLTSASAVALRASLGLKSAALKDEGAGKGLDADLLDGQHGAWYSDIIARLGFTPANKAGDTFTGLVSLGTAVSEKLRLTGSDIPFISFYAADGATRFGYLQVRAEQTTLTNDAGNVVLHAAGSTRLTASLTGISVVGSIAATGGIASSQIAVNHSGANTNSLTLYNNSWGRALIFRAVSTGFLIDSSENLAGGARNLILQCGAVTAATLSPAGLVVVGSTTTSGSFYGEGASIGAGGIFSEGVIRAQKGLRVDPDYSGFLSLGRHSVAQGSSVIEIPSPSVNMDIQFSGTRKFRFNSAGGLSVGHDLTVANNLAVTGSATASGFYVDANFYMQRVGGGLTLSDIAFDAGDIIRFDRTANQFDFYISNNATFSIRPTAVVVGQNMSVSGALSATGAITRAGNKVWDAANDGAGSGLDADLLDGFDASAFARVTSASSNENGGYRVWSDGFKECWGTGFVSANGSTALTYPLTFSSWSKASVEGGNIDAGAQDNNPFISGSSLTSCTAYNAVDKSISVTWRAWGY